MVFSGKVIGGDFMNSTVTTNQRGDLVVQQADRVGIFPKDRKFTVDNVVEWQEVIQEPSKGASLVGTVGQAVAGAALPGLVGKAASAAIGAGAEVANRNRVVRVDWTDGKTSLVRLPTKLFTHLEVVLEYRRVGPKVVPAIEATASSKADVPLDPTGQVLTQVAGIIKDRREASLPPDVLDQIEELADLRDRGILTEDEFVAKKTELLGRL